MEPNADMEALGRKIVADGLIYRLRQETGLSQTAMADFLGVNLITYRKWEMSPTTRLWARTAEKVGRFYVAATRQLTVLSEGGVTLSEYLPFHVAAAYRGLTQEGLLHQYRAGELTGVVDLGVLGLWMERGVVR